MASTCPPAASSTHSTANTAARRLRTARDTFTSPDAARQPEDLSPSPRIRTTATSYLVGPAPLYESDADTVQFPGDLNAVRRRPAEALWPVGLTQQLRHVSVGGARPLVRIQPSPRVAQIPWELLAVDEETDIRLPAVSGADRGVRVMTSLCFTQE
ncbi:hypothetical protein [Streptomyces sp. GbtcB7]|uniref:hypothetical protein n=1 Tax=Streptomyces sp. GbtcB7 TaxID=2824752 RepID=UPI001C309053|nr:hypothetical protein [Streptomyces sp. GbtcB7]